MTQNELKSRVDKFVQILEERKSKQYLPEQPVYVIEECAELIQTLTKCLRQKGDTERVAEEACDVLITNFVLLARLGVSADYVKERLLASIDRAIERLDANGEM